LVRDIELAEEALAAIKGINLFSNLGQLKLTRADWDEIGVLPAFARGGAKAAELSDRVADGAFDAYLPFDMRHDSTRFDEQESTEYIKDALRSWQKGAVYYPFEVRMEMAQLEDQIAALTAELAQENQRVAINKEIQFIANDLAREAAGDVFGQADAAGDLAQDERATPEERLKAQIEAKQKPPTLQELRDKVDSVPPLTTEHLKAIRELKNAAVAEAEAEIEAGRAPVYRAKTGTISVITPSAQKPGMFQVTRYTKTGAFGDSQYKTIRDAVIEDQLENVAMLQPEDAEKLMGELMEAEADFQANKKATSEEALTRYTPQEIEVLEKARAKREAAQAKADAAADVGAARGKKDIFAERAEARVPYPPTTPGAPAYLVPAQRAVVDYMNGDIPSKQALLKKFAELKLTEAQIRSVTNRIDINKEEIDSVKVLRQEAEDKLKSQIVRSMAGRKAKTADVHALATAEKRLDAGDDAEAVRKDTGWFQGVDGKWRFEINDSDAKFAANFNYEAVKNGDRRKLADILTHDNLFAAYPQLVEMTVAFTDKKDIHGSFDSETNTISLNYYDSPKRGLSTLLHEIQHGIQDVEGFASGGSIDSNAMPDAGAMNDAKVLRMRMDRGEDVGEARSWFLNTLGRDAAAEAAYIAQRYTSDELAKMPATPGDRYKRLAGEVEARNVQTRQSMTDEERRATPPSATADVADSDVIVVFNGKVAESAPTPANAGVMMSKRSAAEASTPQTETPAFKKWFGDSKVVDAEGNPLVVYHGTARDFTEFTLGVGGKGGRADTKGAVFFTDSPSQAEFFGKMESRRSGVGARLLPVYLAIKNPLVHDFKGAEKDGDVSAEIIEKAKADGHDGVVFKNVRDAMDASPANVYVAFSPTQIKSATGNQGTFDPANPNILMSKRSGADTSKADKDAEYMAAVERGDMETAQKIVDQAAVDAGYISSNEYRMAHSAPNSKDDTSLLDIRDSGLVPDDYWTSARMYQSTPEEMDSWLKVTSLFRSVDARKAAGKPTRLAGMTVYRAVPKDVKDASIRNGDWVTPSLAYAKNEGEMIPGGYRIISQQASVKDLYWDGNSIAELGYDDGKAYAYKNTKNNRKLTDAVTYDDDGNIIPPSQRFSTRSDDIRMSRRSERTSGDPDPAEAQKVEAALSDKGLVDAAKWMAANAPDKDQRIIATAVAAQLASMEKFGVDLQLKIARVGDRVPAALLKARGHTQYLSAENKTRHKIFVTINGGDVAGKVGVRYQTVLHELVHAATIANIYAGERSVAAGTKVGDAVGRLYDVHNAIVAEVNSRITAYKNGEKNLPEFEVKIGRSLVNAFNDPDETIAWALSSREAQEWLDTIDYPSAGRTIWQELIDAVRAVLGLSPRINSALDEVLSVSKDLLDAEVSQTARIIRTYAWQTGTQSELDTLVRGQVDVGDPEIRMSRRAQTDTPAFRNWFGDSKVVDASGEPLVVYHGTDQSFDEFKADAARSIQADAASQGFYLTRYPEDASGYATGRTGREGANVVPAFVSLQNPYVWPADDLPPSLITAAKRKELEAQGYDGIIYRDGEEIVAFSPTQIKSATGNQGTFDATNPDIRMSNRRQKLSTLGQTYDLPATDNIDAARIKLQDDALRMKRVIEAVKDKGGKVGEAQNFYDANTLMPGRIQSAIDDFKETVIRPMIDKAVEYGIDMDELSMYAYAKHAKERNIYIASINPRMPDGGSGMTDAEADAVIDAVAKEGKTAEYEELHQTLMGITSATRQTMLSEGLITPEEFETLEGAYENYIPLRGFENVVEETGVARPGVGRGVNVRGAETVRAMGRKSKAGDLIENVIRDYERVISRVEKNDVGKVLLDFVLSNPDPDLWGVDVERTKPTFNKAQGTVQYTKSIEKGEDTIGVKVGGQQVYIKLADKELTRALRQAWKDETSGLERATLAMTGWWNNWLRAVLTKYNPAFALINIPRDALWSGTASALAELGPKGLASYLAAYPKAFMASARREAGLAGSSNRLFGNPQMDARFAEFRNAGGITGGFFMRTLDDINQELRNDLLMAGASARNPWEQFKKLPPFKLAKMTLKMLEFMGSASENATRFALYQASREQGNSPAKAGILAKDGTTNFNRKGEWGGALNNLYLFFNAAVQGNAQLFRVLKSPAVQASMAGVAGVGMMLALYGASSGGEDESGEAYWDLIPSYIKERNMVIMLPPGDALAGGIERVGKRGRYLTIPVQYGFNIFPNMGYVMADVLRNAEDPKRGMTPTKAALHMTSVLFGSVNPFGGAVDFSDGVQVLLALSPTIGDPLLQLVNERGTFGTPSAPSKSAWDVRPDSERMFTSQEGTMSAKIAQTINELGGGNEGKGGKILGMDVSVTPGTIQTLISSTTGGLGTFVEQVGSSVLAMTDGEGPPPKAAKIPFLNKFYGEVDEAAGIRTANDRMREVKKLADEVKAQQKLGLDPEVTDEETKLLDLAGMQASYQKMQTQLRKAELEIIKDEKMTDAQKKLERQRLQVERDKLAIEVNREYLKTAK
jgi:hypothetical protein